MTNEKQLKDYDTIQRRKAWEVLEDADLQGFEVAAIGTWQRMDEDRLQAPVFLENPDGGDSIKMMFTVEFDGTSAKVNDVGYELPDIEMGSSPHPAR